jgi:DNA (cytosine-5)-methyltransferase 1
VVRRQRVRGRHILTLKVGSLFSGYGGLDLAVTDSFDAKVVWHCEWEDAPSTVLEAHWPGVPNYRDVSKVDWENVEPVNILTGGFPCQDVSHAGRRAGLKAGTRSGLWSEFAKAIGVLRPSYVVIENVRGLTSAKADSDVEYCPWCMGETDGGGSLMRALGAVLGDLADLGYNAKWTGLRAADAGAPHNRYRIFILAWGGARVSVPTPVVSDVWADGYERAITKESPNRGVGLPTWANRMKLLRTPTAAEVDGKPVHPDVAKAKGQTLRLTSQVLNLLPTPNTQEGSGKCRDYRADLTHAITCDCKNWGDFTPAIERWEQVTNRKAPEPTLPDGQKGQHRLSAKFTEWLMGLPDGWITGHGLHRKDAIKMAGNGVVPQQAKLALTILREGL